MKNQHCKYLRKLENPTGSGAKAAPYFRHSELMSFCADKPGDCKRYNSTTFCLKYLLVVFIYLCIYLWVRICSVAVVDEKCHDVIDVDTEPADSVILGTVEDLIASTEKEFETQNNGTVRVHQKFAGRIIRQFQNDICNIDYKYL